MKKIIRGLIGAAVSAIPFLGAAGLEDTLTQTALHALGGGLVTLSLVWSLGFEFLGSATSYFGRKYYGVVKWENEIEPKILEAFTSTAKGLESDD